MKLYEKEITIRRAHDEKLLHLLAEQVLQELEEGESPIRLAVVESDDEKLILEVGYIGNGTHCPPIPQESAFSFRQRSIENTSDFNAVLLIPTGIDAELGGHSGDGGPVSRLLASSCNRLITHPNVVNASDINELPENGLYVEGSVISRLLQGTVALQPVRANRVMVVMDDHANPVISEHTINAVSAGRAAMGLDCPIIHKMRKTIGMRSEFATSGRAVGRVDNLERLFDVLRQRSGEYDAVALTSVIDVPKAFHQDYFLGGMVNPWGGVEAMLTHAVSEIFNVPSAHSPMMESIDVLNLIVGVVDPRMAAEAVSVAYLHCVLKGLQKSPKIVTDPSQFSQHSVVSAEDISCLVIPDGCVGLPTIAALEQGIPVIAVRENRNLMKNDLSRLPFENGKLFIVDNYLEAAGVMQALQAGVALETVRRPLAETTVHPELREEKQENVVKLRAR